MWRRALYSLVLILLTNQLGLASEIRKFNVGAWNGGAFSKDNGTGEFSHCAAHASYKSNIVVFFFIDANYHWSMMFFNPNWHMPIGTTYNIAFTVDNMSPLYGTATAIRSDAVRVPLLDSVELFNRFKKGYLLRVAAAGQVFGFNLTNTSQLLPALLTCVQTKGARTQVATNPFQSTATAPSAPRAADREDARAEATAFAANLLSLGGVQGFRMLGPAEYPALRGDARWIEGTTFGAIDVYSQVRQDQMKDLPGQIIGGDAKACKGTFFSGAIPDEGKTTARVFTTCQSGNSNLTVYYLAVPRKAGGVYVISSASFGTEEPAKKADENIRQAVLKLDEK
jgi:hypothetical protein